MSTNNRILIHLHKNNKIILHVPYKWENMSNINKIIHMLHKWWNKSPRTPPKFPRGSKGPHAPSPSIKSCMGKGPLLVKEVKGMT